MIGNGPSLRGFDLASLAVDTLGMNAAYRHWDRVGWYPTHYCCLDDELINTHHAQIRRLVETGLVKTAFLSGRMLELEPDTAADPRYKFRDQFNKAWFNRRAAAHGLQYHDHVAFRSSDPTTVTTGSYAVRYAMWLGYDDIGLLGIDLQYVEVIPEARAGDGIKLTIVETPKSNPNYFFDDYQRVGDTFQIPNPAAHDGQLHVRSFTALRNDIADHNLEVSVVNCNKKSILFDEAIFPYSDLTAWQSKRGKEAKLGAVIVPMTPGELSALKRNFQHWAHPSVTPRTTLGEHKPALVLSFANNECATELTPDIERAFDAANLRRFFTGPYFEHLNLTGDRNLYNRDYAKPAGPEGHKSGPNNQFFETMSRAHAFGGHVFYMETDCVPIRPDWLTQVESAIATSPDAWIIGSIYRGIGPIDRRFARHINGNAIYAAGDPAFQRFLFRWRRELLTLLQADKRIAYDCALELLWNSADPSALANSRERGLWRWLQPHAHRFRTINLIYNCSGAADIAAAKPDFVEQVQKSEPDAFLVHGRPALEWVEERARSEQGCTTDAAPQPLPRLLLMDFTAIGNGSATGELKAAYFNSWPAEQLLHVHTDGPASAIAYRGKPSQRATPEEIAREINQFEPEVVLYRPTDDRPQLHDLAMEIILTSGAPLATWIMDDWPERLAQTSPAAHKRYDRDLRELFGRAAINIAISDEMAFAFAARYGTTFKVRRNGVRRKDWQSPSRRPPGEIVVRYAGGLATDMTFSSVLDTAKAISELRTEVPIRFEIATHRHWRESKHIEALAAIEGVFIRTSNMKDADYRKWLQGADILLVAYNFDEATERYVRYSFSNKAPECLASGRAVLAYGPASIATIQHLQQSRAARVVSERDPDQLKRALSTLSTSPIERERLGEAGRQHAFAAFDLDKSVLEFHAQLRESARFSGQSATRDRARNRSASQRHDATAKKKADRLLVLSGGAPSSSELELLRRAPTMSLARSMHAWVEAGHCPTYFACLDRNEDRVSNAAIAALIRRADGPQSLLLREHRMHTLGPADLLTAKVQCYEWLSRLFELFTSGPATTASHAALWATLLGYRSIILLNVDFSGEQDDFQFVSGETVPQTQPDDRRAHSAKAWALTSDALKKRGVRIWASGHNRGPSPFEHRPLRDLLPDS